MKIIRTLARPSGVLSLIALSVLVSNVLLASSVAAGALTTNTLRLNRMATGTATSFRLVFRTASAGATTASINFNGGDSSNWVGASGVVNSTQTISSASCAADTGATALPGSLSASGSSPTISITGITALSASTTYCVDLTSASAVTNPTTAAEYHPVVTVGSDSNTVAVRIITNDQVAVSAAVQPTFNFVLSGNSDSFTAGLLPSTVTSTTGVSATVNTNAKTGWFVWARDASTGLNSPSQSKTIASTTPGTAATLSAGTEGYVLGLTSITQGSGAGTASAATAYDATASSGVNANGSGLDATLRQVASSTGTANGASLTFKERAAISSTTPAATDYADTITFIGAGSY